MQKALWKSVQKNGTDAENRAEEKENDTNAENDADEFAERDAEVVQPSVQIFVQKGFADDFAESRNRAIKSRRLVTWVATNRLLWLNDRAIYKIAKSYCS